MRRTQSTAMARTAAGVLAALAAAGPGALAQDDASRLDVARVADGVYVVSGAGGNIGVSVGEDGVLIVDDQVAEISDALAAVLAELSPEPVGWVINTHWHHDHTGGNERLGARGALIVSHDNTRPRLMAKQTLVPPMTGGEAPALPPDAWPVVTFSRDITFHFNGEEIHVFHVAAAHTDGDAIVHFKNADVIHMGDVFFNGLYPNIDNGAGGAIAGMIAALDLVGGLAGPQTKVIAGHGPVGDRDDVRRAADMLRIVERRVAALIEDGASEDEAVAAAPLADLEPDWGWYIDGDRMVRHAYKSIAAAR